MFDTGTIYMRKAELMGDHCNRVFYIHVSMSQYVHTTCQEAWKLASSVCSYNMSGSMEASIISMFIQHVRKHGSQHHQYVLTCQEAWKPASSVCSYNMSVSMEASIYMFIQHVKNNGSQYVCLYSMSGSVEANIINMFIQHIRKHERHTE